MRIARVLLGLLMLAAAWSELRRPQTASEASAQQKASESKPAYTLPTEKLAKAIEYSRKRVVLEFVETGWGIAQLVLLLVLGVAAWMRDVAVRRSGNRWVQGFTFFFLFLAISTVLELPLDMYGHHLSVAYGQSVQHWGSWFGDQAKSFGLAWVVGGLLVMLLFRVIKISDAVVVLVLDSGDVCGGVWGLYLACLY